MRFTSRFVLGTFIFTSDMRKIILYTAASEDYFIAEEDGAIDWLHNPEYEIAGEDFGYAEMYDAVDTLLIGNKTLELVDGFDMPFPYIGKKVFAFSKTPANKSHEHASYVAEDIVSFCIALKKQKGQNIWLVGGGQISSILLKAQLVDEIHLTKIPITLEKGIPLCEPLDLIKDFQLQATRSYDNGFVKLILEKGI